MPDKVCSLPNVMAAVLLATALLAAGVAQATTCAEAMPEVRAEIDTMTSNADKNIAEHQFERAQERLASGKEKSCLRYLESARAAIEAWQMHDD